MPVTSLPDVFGALLSKARATSAITALTSTRIADEVKTDWNFVAGQKIQNALVWQGPIGGPGELEMPLYRERYDARCYGATKLDALKLARTVRAAYIPPDGGAIGFTYGDAAVMEMAEETGPIRLVEPDTRWHCVVIPYLVTYCGVPVS